MQKVLNGAEFRKMVMAGTSLLEKNKNMVDSLNVFPVPDGDTGTNMYLTLKSAANEVSNCVSNNIENLCEAYAKGALRGARGNSGVITSQIVKGITNVLAKEKQITTKVFAKALSEGAKVAYQAVTVPKEGTILTVIRGVAEYAQEICKKATEFEEFFSLILEKGDEVLAQTPEMLPVLKKAGVVDAGGKGLLVVLTGYYRAILGDEELDVVFEEVLPQTEEETYADLNNLGEIEFAYCTEFMIVNLHKKTTEADIDILREKLLKIGDSLICIGDLQQVKVHVHTNQPNRALGYALELGELYNMKIENMLEQNRELKRKAEAAMANLKDHGMVSVVPGKGIGDLFKDLSVDELIEGGQTMNPSAADIAKAVNKVQAKNVFVFPNNKNIILAAEQAKELTDKNVIVVPSRSVPEGIAAALCFNPEGSEAENFETMSEALSHVKSGSVTYAVRDTNIDGFSLTAGEVIGLDNKSILSKGTTISETTEVLIEKLIDDSIINIVLFYGAEVREDEANELAIKLQEKFPKCEIQVLYGGQPVYYYIISLE
ncbi:MAG: DAK2 domain-containing protein [Christensenellales bacterium]|jgi:DAK2 domain fusion protein YloV